MNPFQSLSQYEALVYTLPQSYPQITRSTLVVVRRGRGFAQLSGELLFADGHRLVVSEILNWDIGAIVIQHYGYEVWLGSEKLYWYDSQPHPDDSSLASTHPHHKHIAPNIKQHRIPAPGLSFTEPNLAFLIDEIGSRSEGRA